MFFKNKRSKKKNENQLMTFIIIPHTAKKPLKLNVTKKTVSRSIMALGLFVVCFVVLAYAHYSSQWEIQQVNAIKQENRQKDDVIKLLSEEIEEIILIQQNIDKKQEEIKKLMGIKGENETSEVPSSGGQGGSDGTVILSLEMNHVKQVQSIKTILSLREKELDDYAAKVKNDENYFRAIPNQWPTVGEITSPFGWRTSPFRGRGQTFHDGIDIANSSGTDIVAAGDGRVTFSGWMPVFGRTIMIDHGYGYVSKYGHNSSLLVKQGESVNKGDLIAKMGSTGQSTGPHLHFTIFKWDNAQDPLIYLP